MIKNQRVCSDCHHVFNDNDNYINDWCDNCQKKRDKIPSTFNSENWIRFIKKLQDREWAYDQLKCPQHSFMILPKSGKYLGIPLWRCNKCNAVTQST